MSPIEESRPAGRPRTDRSPEAIAAALTRTCPHCHAGPGRRCHAGNGHSAVPTHTGRIKAGARG